MRIPESWKWPSSPMLSMVQIEIYSTSKRTRRKFARTVLFECLLLFAYIGRTTETKPSPSPAPTEPESHIRVNTKHLNKLFNRFSFFIRPQVSTDAHFLATTIDSVQSGNLLNNINSHNSKIHDFTRKNDKLEYFNTKSTNFYLDLNPSQTTTTTPSNVLSNEFEINSTSDPLSRVLYDSTTNRYPNLYSGTVVLNDNHKPEMCKCVCNSVQSLESHDIPLTDLKEKILEPAIKSQTEQPIADVLDSLVDPDESDYDDVEELEELQKPNKYIPMEMIELSHRRPTTRKPTMAPTTARPTTSKKPLLLLSAPSTSIPKRNSSILPSRVPLYNFSFIKSVTNLKYMATRALQIGAPLMIAAVLGNVISHVEVIDRHSPHTNYPVIDEKKLRLALAKFADSNAFHNSVPIRAVNVDDSNNNFNGKNPNNEPAMFATQFGNPTASPNNNGYYSSYYDNLGPVNEPQPNWGYSYDNRRRGRSFRWFKSKQQQLNKRVDQIDGEWQESMDIFRRWLHRFD